jgi:hypothetical protein|tara:strand:+ start:507 stop:716 length:210 start_codon:yes stop_codon:yes gene_type:complete
VIESESLAQPTAFIQQSKPSTAGNNRLSATLEIPDEHDYETTVDETTITAEREQEQTIESSTSVKNDWR